MQPLCRPNTEECTLLRFDTITDGDNNIKIVIIDIIAFAVFGSCSEIPNN